MITPLSNAERQRNWYVRKQAGTPWQPLTCEACGANHTGRHGVICSRCWERLTPNGRAAKAKRVRDSRARKKQLVTYDVM